VAAVKALNASAAAHAPMRFHAPMAFMVPLRSPDVLDIAAS
jgi:hypothetical protein